MQSHRLTRRQSDYLEALTEGTAALPWAPDGLTFEDVLPLKTQGNAQLRRSKTQPTTWLLMDEEDRAAIRRRLRPTQTTVPDVRRGDGSAEAA